MIKYNFNQKEKKLTIKGHADYSEYGKDIICSSVSTLIISSTNLLIKFGEEKNIKYHISDGMYEIKILNENKINGQIFYNIIDHLRDLKKQYPNYIKEVL